MEYRCAKASKWFQNKSLDEYFWRNIQILPKKKLNLNQNDVTEFYEIPKGLISFVMNQGCEYMNLSIYGSSPTVGNIALPRKNHLKQLKLNNLVHGSFDNAISFASNQDLFLELILISESLIKLGLNGARINENLAAAIIQHSETLDTLDISGCYEVGGFIEEIVSNCKQLRVG